MGNSIKNFIFLIPFLLLLSVSCSIYAPSEKGMRIPSSEGGKVVVVTGGASGLGLEIVKRYSNAGFQVVIAARRPPTDPTILNSSNVVHIMTDLENSADLKSLVDEVMTRFGSLDLLIHNAAMASLESTMTVDSEILRRTVQTNYIAPAELSAYALKRMEEEKKPLRIIYVSSAAAIMPKGEFARYGATKAASEIHFLTLNQEIEEMKAAGKMTANHDVAIVRPAFIRGNYTPGATGSPSELSTAAALRNLSPTSSEDVVDEIFSISQKKNMPELKNVGLDGALMELGHRMFSTSLLSKIQNAAISVVKAKPVNLDLPCTKQLSEFISTPLQVDSLKISGAALLTFMLSSDERHKSK